MSSHEIARIIHELGRPDASPDARRLHLRRFAHAAGWHPSEELLDYPITTGFSSSHLVVEFGLENTAVLSFLNEGQATADLTDKQRNALLSLSYNNLVDWHLVPDVNGLSVYHNRTEDPWLRYVSRHEATNPWSAATFDRIRRIKLTGARERLDEALIKTISLWRLELRALLGEEAPPQDLSAFFNLILFLRASEDQRRWQGLPDGDELRVTDHRSFTDSMRLRFLRLLMRDTLPAYLESYLDRARTFDRISASFLGQLLTDFTRNRFLPQYEYDFSIISKHALSLIYERYVALFRDAPHALDQGLFPELPAEISNKDIGAVYTPQYIARFFARFIEYHRPKRLLAETTVVDPACGSGIFLRTYLEVLLESFSSAQVHLPEEAFARVTGLDKDPSAVDASVLSLALLHLIATDRLPDALDVRHVDSLASFRDGTLPPASFDVAIANPPFVSWDRMDDSTRQRLRALLGDNAGRPDMFAGFATLGQALLKPAGLFLYVLPHAFLIADSCSSVRASFASDFTIHMVVDLSAVRVFESVNTYVILLVAEKIPPPPTHEVTVVRCHDRVGRALVEALAGKTADTPFYQIFKLQQSKFRSDGWRISAEATSVVEEKLEVLPKLNELLWVHEGMITGKDDIFMIPRSEVPEGESEVWMPFLSDREMLRFATPKRVSHAVFYPYTKGGLRVDLPTLKDRFPGTWNYLRRHSKQLRERKSVKSQPQLWWAPVRSRSPAVMRSPKIVAPHLISTPRFGIDMNGRFGVSRCPLLIPRADHFNQDHLDYYCAILNSSVILFQLTGIAHVYDRGYLMLEPKTLKRLRLPRFEDVEPTLRRQVINYAARLRQEPGEARIEALLDQAVASLFQLEDRERESVGVLR